MCKYSHIRVGSTVTLSIFPGNCGKCGQSLYANKAQASYGGHTDERGRVEDVFYFTSNPIVCDQCGARCGTYSEPCEDYTLQLQHHSFAESNTEI